MPCWEWHRSVRAVSRSALITRISNHPVPRDCWIPVDAWWTKLQSVVILTAAGLRDLTRDLEVRERIVLIRLLHLLQ